MNSIPRLKALEIWKYSPSHARLVLREPNRSASSAILFVGVVRLEVDSWVYDPIIEAFKTDEEFVYVTIKGKNSNNYIKCTEAYFLPASAAPADSDYLREGLPWTTLLTYDRPLQ